MNRGAWQPTAHEVARVGHDLVTKPSPSTRTACNYVHLAKANKISNYSDESIKILVLLNYPNFYPTA